jgi:hypothetical protein
VSPGNVVQIAGGAEARRRRLSLKARMVLGYISEQEYRRALSRANGGQVIRFARPKGSEP